MSGHRLILSNAILVALSMSGGFSPQAAAADGLSLPPGAVLESATLELEQVTYGSSSESETVLVHRITADWDETLVTWNNFGGSYDPAVVGSFAADGALKRRSVDVTSLVADWLSGAQPNYGFLLRQESIDLTQNLKYSEYASSESALPRPSLTICYSLPGGESESLTIQRGTLGEVTDAYIWELPAKADENHGGSATLFIGVVYYAEKQALIRFELPTIPPPPCAPGTGTPGYWMNHPEAWPVDEITIGGVTYSRDDAIALIKAPVKKDKTFTVFASLASAMLNVMVGNESSCIDDTIAHADAWMAAYPVGSGVPAKDAAWKACEPLHVELDDYNNGLLCAPKREAMGF
ncbi:MAG: DNRLRE domain-containing protein [Planctomycetes bacterium]|nr:DNRLRE domain-containing protein [Planctomycetota bacterium]